MKLSTIVASIIRTYNLPDDESTLTAKLKFAGLADDVHDASKVIDLALSMQNGKNLTTAAAVYASAKDSSKKAVEGSCPICGTSMADIDLVSRDAKYCQACHVVMPNRNSSL